MFRLLPVIAFILSLAAPISTDVMVGSLRLSVYRLVLIFLIAPCFLKIFSGRAGRLDATDWLILGFAVWPFLSLTALHGIGAAWEASGIFFIETAGSYLIARCFIRSPADMRNAVFVLFILILSFIPFAMFEAFTGKQILQFGGARIGSGELRLGLFRALGPFDHQILYGVFCASILGLSFYCLRGKGYGFLPIVRGFLVFLSTFFSLSSGPLLAFVIQFYLIIWDLSTKWLTKRWQLLIGLFVLAYVVVDLLSSRTPVEVFISYMTFNPGNSYMRILIWEYGTASVMTNPLFGVGLGDWERAWFMSGTMDNFWLVNAVRYGLPSFLLLASGFLTRVINLARLKTIDRTIRAFRKGWLISMVGLAVAGGTVHYWDAVFCLFMFILGSSQWMLQHGSK